jgi:hypothetical protein
MQADRPPGQAERSHSSTNRMSDRFGLYRSIVLGLLARTQGKAVSNRHEMRPPASCNRTFFRMLVN